MGPHATRRRAARLPKGPTVFPIDRLIRTFVRAMLALTLPVAFALAGLAADPSPAVASTAPPTLPVQMLDGVNRVRTEAGLAPLAPSEALDLLAAERSADMASRRYFSHTTPDGLDVFALMAQRGIEYRTAGENLAWNTYNQSETSAQALTGFLDSPPHRAILLGPAFTQLGVGVARDGQNTYFTLVFVG